jgi:hypothetical protein
MKEIIILINTGITLTSKGEYYKAIEIYDSILVLETDYARNSPANNNQVNNLMDLISHCGILLLQNIYERIGKRATSNRKGFSKSLN